MQWGNVSGAQPVLAGPGVQWGNVSGAQVAFAGPGVQSSIGTGVYLSLPALPLNTLSLAGVLKSCARHVEGVCEWSKGLIESSRIGPFELDPVTGPDSNRSLCAVSRGRRNVTCSIG